MGWLQNDIGFEGWRLDFARGWVPQARVISTALHTSGIAMRLVGSACGPDPFPREAGPSN